MGEAEFDAAALELALQFYPVTYDGGIAWVNRDAAPDTHDDWRTLNDGPEAT